MSTDTTVPASEELETLEALQQRHRKEQRDLVSRITQKKKQATKKTRKGVNDECERLETELKEKQAAESAALNGESVVEAEDGDVESEQNDHDVKEDVMGVQVEGLRINSTTASTTPISAVNSAQNDANITGKKKNRQKERLARRKAEQDAVIAQAEEEARNAPNPRELEKQLFEPLLESNNLSLHEIRADGHCLYAAVADQLATRSLSLSPRIPITPAENDKAPP